MFQQRSKNRLFKPGAALALALFLPGLVHAQGSTPYIGQLLFVGFNFTPPNWNQCDGSSVSISANPTLFDLIGTTYGGDGVNTYNLPDMRGRAPIHQGSNGSQSYTIGQQGGSETQALTVSEMPAHTHAISFSAPISGASGVATSAVPGGHSLGNTGRNLSYSTAAPDVNLATAVSTTTTATGNAGGSTPFSIRQPYLTVNCLIAEFGVFPSQN